MSGAIMIERLISLHEKTSKLRRKFSALNPTPEQLETLCDLSSKLAEAAKTTHEEIRAQKQARSNQAWEDSQKFRSEAQRCLGELFENGQLPQAGSFRRNIVTIFAGPKESANISRNLKSRHNSTRERCELIRDLTADSVVIWAIGVPSSIWVAGLMSLDVFTCLLYTIKSQLVQTWPQIIRDELHLLAAHEALINSPEYEKFLKAINDPAESASRKRQRVNNTIEQGKSTDQSLLPYSGNREMKYMYSNAPTSSISKLPELFRTAVENSQLWKWERSQNLETTGCWTSIIPVNHTQDVSISIWCGHDDGYRINDALDVELTVTSSTLNRTLAPRT